MSDEQVEYIDEHGNPVDPADIGDDVVIEEVVEEPAAVPQVTAPVAEPQPESAPVVAGKPPRMLLVGIVAAVAVVVGGAIFGLQGLGNQHTTGDVKEAIATKTDAVKTTVEQRKDEVEHPPIDVCNDLGRARTDGAVTAPAAMSLRLRVVGSAPLPPQLRTGKAPQILQLTTDNWGIYAPQPQPAKPVDDFAAKTAAKKATWWKSVVSTGGNKVVASPANTWPGGDTDASGACPAGEPGTYAVAGDVPADAAGLRKGQAEVTAIKGDASTAGTSAPQGDSANRVLAVMGGSVVLAVLEYAPEPAPTTAAPTS